MKRGFTLIEVLVAGGVLFIVSAAVVGLSNSIIQGTSKNSDRTEANRWATEGLELVNKIRNDSVKVGGTLVNNNEKIWFAPAADVANYGWYTLQSQTIDGVTTWSLSKTIAPPHLSLNQASTYAGTPLHNAGVTASRLICVEAYGAVDESEDANYINCNSADKNGNSQYNDGTRLLGTDCQPTDSYCLATRSSLNRNRQTANRYISAGNAVKVRSVVIWPNRTDFVATELATVFANWKGFEQEL